MKLDHLTFGQLYKLAHATTLMRVTRAYHSALRTGWREAGIPVQIFSAHKAEEIFQRIASRYGRVLNFLRGPELKRAVRKSAKEQPVTITPGAPFPFMTVNRFKFPVYKDRLAVSGLILMHCRHNGVPAACRVTADGDFEIRAETGPLGCLLLMYKPGLKVSTVDSFCRDMGIATWGPFPWLPVGTPFNARINPCVWPVNTPDRDEIARDLIYAPEN